VGTQSVPNQYLFLSSQAQLLSWIRAQCLRQIVVLVPYPFSQYWLGLAVSHLWSCGLVTLALGLVSVQPFLRSNSQRTY